MVKVYVVPLTPAPALDTDFVIGNPGMLNIAEQLEASAHSVLAAVTDSLKTIVIVVVFVGVALVTVGLMMPLNVSDVADVFMVLLLASLTAAPTVAV